MNIISQAVEIIPENLGVKKKIELCGRVCYKSEDKITEDSAARFVNTLIRRGHTSVLEHARINLCEFHDERYDDNFNKVRNYTCYRYDNEDFSRISRIYSYSASDPGFYFSLNCRDYLAIVGDSSFISYPEAGDYMTVRFTTNRAVANELVRHRVFSFSQESTRYCNYRHGLTFIGDNEIENCTDILSDIEKRYTCMTASGVKPEIVRNILPLCTKTELVMTGTYDQWSELLKLRMPKAAHPQIRELMTLLVNDKNFPEEIQVPDVSHE